MVLVVEQRLLFYLTRHVLRSQTGCSCEDEVEIPVFHYEDDVVSSPTMASNCNLELDEEILSDDEEINLHTSGHKKQDVVCTWSGVTKEAQELVHSIENARSSSLHPVTSNVNKLCKGRYARGKSKLLFQFQSHESDIFQPVSGKADVKISYEGSSVLQELEAVDNKAMKSPTAEILETFQGGKIEQSENSGVPAEMAIGHKYMKYSMTELLDSYKDRTGLPEANSTMYTRRRGQRLHLVHERNISPLGERNLDNKDPPEALDSQSSTDDEESPQAHVQNLGLINPEHKEKTMTDKFQEAFGATSIHNGEPHFALDGTGLFGKLQQVMQSENKRDANFLKRLETAAGSKDEANCINVEILSKCSEAKLTICCCSLSIDKENSQLVKSLQKQMPLTVIFNSRICYNVELEVGNLIRIHPPWNEIQAGERDGVIILSAYFSQVFS
ncbi:uncharacterized protein LOC127796516 isoform X2 [Diospyros lotus]|uniref:uncharacterized protein LOC127796516 isoform X2 n=1 Tax=Diospyros lotus TaxID=55363 RepID=UPI002255B1D8|nr:uncharacterized protein LOC127796516 isoform X2 [Diospyros lotus]